MIATKLVQVMVDSSGIYEETKGRMTLQLTLAFRNFSPSHSILGALGWLRSADLALAWDEQWIALPAETVVVTCVDLRFALEVFDAVWDARKLTPRLLALVYQWCSRGVLTSDVGKESGRTIRSIVPSMNALPPHLFWGMETFLT